MTQTKAIQTLDSKAFVFDLDGTLIDTTPLVVKYWTNFANEHGLDPAQILASSHGRRTFDTIQRWVPVLANDKYVNEFESKLAKETEGVIILPGVMDLLSQISEEDWTVNTAGTHMMATTRLSQFNIKVPKEMATGDKLTKGKPDPEGYLLAAKLLHKDPKDCIVFEDADAGVRAAIAAGMKCIACLTTHTYEQLKEAGATVIVDRLDSVHIEKQEDGSYKTIIENAYEL
ncbi:HAD-like domain-containing protein [Cokeromyces recurvatus]|uniref:HAD-like domain-containing protein n=1 Tax=Cokeromyces recurvatus TaxID=90255 RepID=UPI002220A953|nr:HAD-like domain-containing protein [Cokeromyces recurvatus]KAI7897721.1 HAD-like domain-containing protein [Cokeromyces recurvatus]